jgi:hypothetical protein
MTMRTGFAVLAIAAAASIASPARAALNVFACEPE